MWFHVLGPKLKPAFVSTGILADPKSFNHDLNNALRLAWAESNVAEILRTKPKTRLGTRNEQGNT